LFRQAWLAALLGGASLASSAEAPPPALSSALPGYCAVAFDRQRVHLQRVGGHSDASRQLPYGTTTIQPVASISKTVIGIVLAQMAVRGDIDLDAPLETWLPWKVRNPRFAEVPITLRQLATHTSGLLDRDEIYQLGYQPGDVATMAMRDFLARYTKTDGAWFDAANFGAAPPGARHEYSNLGAALAAVVIEIRTGKDFAELARKAVFEPLGMFDTTLRIDLSKLERTAALFGPGGTHLKRYALVTYADGGMRTTCRDLTVYMQAVMRAHAGEPSALDRAAVALMLAPQFPPNRLPENFKRPNQGLFWQFNAREGLGHSGSDPGVSAHAYFDATMTHGRVFIANGSAEDDERYAESARTIWRSLPRSWALP
jgi:CubicO group peptidase (beta-lactamase class C family)